jgi:hypothetical protein
MQRPRCRRRPTIRRLLSRGVPALALLLAVSSVAAWAFWSTTGTGTAAATTATLAATQNTVPASGTNFVTVTWTQQAFVQPGSSGAGAITYSVERKLGSGAWVAISSGGCSGAKAHGTTSCVDSPPASGSYSYRVVATYHSWTATSSDAGPVAYVFDNIDPVAQSIARLDASPANAATVRWTVTFSEPVTGVDSGDFALARAGGVTGGTISSVSGSGATYTVTSSTGSGDGTLGLNVVDDDTITDAGANKLGGTGTANGNLTGQTYTIDKTAPTVSSIVRAVATPTNAATLTWTVTFSEAVTGVGSGDFALAATGPTGTAITLVSGSGTTYIVTASTGAGSGTLGLNLADDDTITDTATNKLGGTGAGNGNLTGEIYTIDKTAPVVSSVVRLDPTPSALATVRWTVTFSKSVTGVEGTDLSLAATGPTGTALTQVSGSGATYTVTASTGAGDGTLGLNIVDDDTIIDSLGNNLADTGTGNGNFIGQTYTIDRPPTVSAIALVSSTPTNAASLSWTVTFSESVTGVGTADFTLTAVGPTGTSISGVAGSGATYTVTAASGSGSGTLRLNLVDDDTIIDATANKLGGTGAGNGSLTGQTYTIDKTPPTLSAVAFTNAVAPSSTPCGIAATTRFVNNSGKAAVGVSATIAATEPGGTIVFSVTTPGSTAVTATVASTGTTTTATLDLSAAPFLDGTTTLTARASDALGNQSALVSPTNIVIKDTTAPLSAAWSLLGGPPLGLGAHVAGDAECGATVSVVRAAGGTPGVQAITSGTAYDISTGLLGLGPYNVTSTDLVGNVHAAISVG